MWEYEEMVMRMMYNLSLGLGLAGGIVGPGYISSGYILGCSQRLDISIFAALLFELHLYIIDGPDHNPKNPKAVIYSALQTDWLNGTG